MCTRSPSVPELVGSSAAAPVGSESVRPPPRATNSPPGGFRAPATAASRGAVRASGDLGDVIERADVRTVTLGTGHPGERMTASTRREPSGPSHHAASRSLVIRGKF